MYHMKVFYRKILGLELVTKTFLQKANYGNFNKFERIMK